MTAFESWIASPAARALGWALLHFLWQGAAIALLLAVALWLCRAARTRYLLASGAMAAMVLAFAVTLAVCWPSADQRPVRTAKLTPAAVLRLPPAGPNDRDLRREAAPPRWFVPVWLTGVAFFYCYSLAAWLAARRLKTRGTIPAPLVWQDRLRQLAADLGIRRTIALLESCLTDVPVVIGYLRPVILLPLGMLAGLDTAQVEAILLHELAHIRRYDYVVNLLQTVVEGLLFYHPAIWWAGAVMRREREHCCDDLVVHLQGDAHGYAATLARLELGRGTAREPALAATGGDLMKRIHRLLQQPEGPRVAAPLVSAAILLATATLAVAAWQTATPTPAPAAVAPQPSAQPRPLTPRQQRIRNRVLLQTMETPYRKWLADDVAYIITDAERATFKNLQTDEERENFIEQFWLLRDPTPGTVENEFKEEHYRRIAYSNEHFFTPTGLPGWKTDRGRIYITYGPPDEIEDHPAGNATTAPFQDWLYRHIQGIGNNVIIEFLDSARNGEFRMTMDPSEKNAGGLAIAAHIRPVTEFTRLVSLSVPLSGQGHESSITGRVTTTNGRPVATFEDHLGGLQSSYTKEVPLVPGIYNVTFIIQDQVTKSQQQGRLTLTVQ